MSGSRRCGRSDLKSVAGNFDRRDKPESTLDEPFLHAKFLFGASYRENSSYCNSPWVYLGSGNLTNPGFANPASTHGGNLEAGVVFLPEPLLWENHGGIRPNRVSRSCFPFNGLRRSNTPTRLFRPVLKCLHQSFHSKWHLFLTCCGGPKVTLAACTAISRSRHH